jgi:hypothetical protein
MLNNFYNLNEKYDWIQENEQLENICFFGVISFILFLMCNYRVLILIIQKILHIFLIGNLRECFRVISLNISLEELLFLVLIS